MKETQQCRRIGFIIDYAGSPGEEILYVLTDRADSHDQWMVWKPWDDENKSKARSAQEYAQYLFMLIGFACKKILKTTQCGDDYETLIDCPPVSIYGSDTEYGSYARRVSRVIENSQAYKAIPDSVRRALSPLIVQTGRRKRVNPDERVTILARCVYDCLVWTARDPPVSLAKLDDHARVDKPLHIASNERALLPQQVITLAEQIRRPLVGNTWNALYRRHLLNYDYVASPRWIRTIAMRVPDVVEDTLGDPRAALRKELRRDRYEVAGAPLTIEEMVVEQKNLILTGPAGAGKTTTLRLLEALCLTDDEVIGPECLPFYIPLKSIDYIKERASYDGNDIDISELVACSASIALRRKCARQDLVNCDTIRTLIQGKTVKSHSVSMTMDDMLKHIEEEVAQWFTAYGQHDPNVLLLLDGYNECYFKDGFVPILNGLLCQECRIVIACRSDFADDLQQQFTSPVTRYEIEKLDDDQIIDYLDHFVPEKGEDIFLSHIRSDQKLLSAARIPFFLSLIVKHLQKNKATQIPKSKALLIQSFVDQSIRRKHEEEIHLSRILADVIYDVLCKLARWCINYTFTRGQSGYPASFKQSGEFGAIEHSNSQIYAVLEAAEKYGLLRMSGLMEGTQKERGFPDFTHDYIRDFFGAHELQQAGGLFNVPGIQDIMEYREWDGALEIYFSLLEDTRLFEEDFKAIVTFDPFLAARCLTWSPVAKQEHSEYLLHYLPFKWPETVWYVDENPEFYGILATLACALTVWPADSLFQLYCDNEALVNQRQAVPRALALALGEKAVPYLERMIRLDILNDTFIVSALVSIGTSEAWELICVRYIELARANNGKAFGYEDAIKHDKFRPAPTLIMKMIQKSQDALAHLYAANHRNYFKKTIAHAIKSLGSKYRSILIEYKDCDDDIIALMALRGLARLKQVNGVEGLLEILRDNKTHFRLFASPSWDLEVLCKANSRVIDSELCKIFNNHLKNETYYNSDISQIPRLLSHRINAEDLDEMICLVLHSDTLYTADALKSLLYAVPRAVCQKADNLLPKVGRNNLLWYRIIICQAYCGQDGASEELLKVASHLDEHPWTNNKSDYRVYRGTETSSLIRCLWQCLVLQVIRERRLLKAVPILEGIANTSKEWNVQLEAKESLVALWPFTDKVRTAQQIETCIDYVSTRHPLYGYSVAEISGYFCRCMHLWAPQEIQYLFVKITNKIAEASAHHNMLLSRELYHLLAELREISDRRFLNVFRNWPTSSKQNKSQANSHK